MSDPDQTTTTDAEKRFVEWQCAQLEQMLRSGPFAAVMTDASIRSAKRRLRAELARKTKETKKDAPC